MTYFKKFTVTEESGHEVGAVNLQHLWADVYGIQLVKTEHPVSAKRWMETIAKALLEVKSQPARLVMFRLIEDAEAHELRALLPALGFVKKHERVEYRKSVSELPSDEGTPFTWKNAAQLNFSPEQIASVLSEVSVGDPDHEAEADPLLYIQDFLSDPVLSSGLDCIHFGFVGDVLAAMAVVQINPKTGWSRISHMGILPEFRGKKLGVWVHRFAFAQMKREGSLLYHGGTVATNEKMVRLFLAHHCDFYRRMEEWVYFTK